MASDQAGPPDQWDDIKWTQDWHLNTRHLIRNYNKCLNVWSALGFLHNVTNCLFKLVQIMFKSTFLMPEKIGIHTEHDENISEARVWWHEGSHSQALITLCHHLISPETNTQGHSYILLMVWGNFTPALLQWYPSLNTHQAVSINHSDKTSQLLPLSSLQCLYLLLLYSWIIDVILPWPLDTFKGHKGAMLVLLPH